MGKGKPPLCVVFWATLMWFCDEIASAGDDSIYNFRRRPTVRSFSDFPFVSHFRPARTVNGKNSVHFHFQETSVYFSMLRTVLIFKHRVDDVIVRFTIDGHCPCRAIFVVILKNAFLPMVTTFATRRAQSSESWICVFQNHYQRLTLKIAGC